MKKALSLLISLVMIFSLFAATVAAEGEAVSVKVLMTEQDFSDGLEIDAGNGITISFAKGNGQSAPAYINPEVRVYLNNTITISVSSETDVITSITFTLNSNKSSVLNASVGTYEDGSWAGSTNSVIFTNPNSGKTGQVWISAITVNLNGATEEPPVTYDTPEEIVNALYELDPGATLPGGPYTLTGVITAVTGKYSTEHDDITVVMVVGDMTGKPVTCYYLINADGVDGVSMIGVGDTITVKGELTHYQNKSGVSTYEFAKNCELTEFTAYPKFASKQLSLAGDLGVHFYMDLRSLPEDALDDTYMEFTVSGKTVKVGFDPENTNTAGEYYGFTCRVNVLQMAENIHAVFHYGDSTVETDYSVEKYIGYIFEHTDDYDTATVNLVSAICDYGYFSQQYLHECNGVKLGENGYAAQSPSPYGINLYEDYSTLYAMEKSAELYDGAKFTYCLVLDSEITLELYVTVPDGEIFYGILASFDDEMYDNDNIEDLGGGRFRVTIPGISATQLETWIQVDYDGTTVRRLCPLSYAAAVKNADISENASNWADSLACLYYSAAAYANNN